MTKGWSHKRSIHRGPAEESSNAVENPQQQEAQPEHSQNDPWAHRLRIRMATANKAVLAAAGTGILGAITAGVLALPHLAASLVHGSPPPLTVVGGPSAKNIGSATKIPCVFGKEFILPGTAHLPQVMSTSQVSAMLNNAADIDIGSTSGTYTLQASSGQTVVITAVHTIVLRRVLAPRATEVEVVPTCDVSGATIINLSVNLDGNNLSPKIATPDPGNPNRSIILNGLQTTVTNDSPIIINFEADTDKYDVTWEMVIDYTVDGQSKEALIRNGSQPFHTMAGRSNDTGLTVALNSRGTAWSVTKSSAAQIDAG